MSNPTIKPLLASVAAALVLAACAHTTSPTMTAQAPGSVAALATDPDRAEIAPSKSLGTISLEDGTKLGLTPEKAEDKARERAIAWHPDAELRFVGWGVLKWQLLSAVSHVFYSPSSQEVLVVKTVMREKWQSADAFDHPLVTKPALVLQALASDYKIGGSRALKLARRHFIVSKHPVSLVTLSRPIKLPFAFWGVIGDGTVVLVHANTGQSLSPRGVDPFPKEWHK